MATDTMSKTVTELVNTDENTVLPVPGLYTLVVTRMTTRYAVRVNGERRLVMRSSSGGGDWNNPSDLNDITDTWNRSGGHWKLIPYSGTDEVLWGDPKYVSPGPDMELPDTPVTPTLTPGTFYEYGSQVMLATAPDRLLSIRGNETPVPDATGIAEYSFTGGVTKEEKLLEFITYSARDLRTVRSSFQRQVDHLEGLKAAILEKAEEQDWCSEYDDFAEEWDLFPRLRSYEVIVSVPVRAKDYEEAEELVSQHITLDESDEGIEDRPSFDVREA